MTNLGASRGHGRVSRLRPTGVWLYVGLACLLLLGAAGLRYLDDQGRYYIGLALLVAVALVALYKAYRVWEEIHDVEEPDSPADLLQSFSQAHAAGELDDDEFDRVRRRLESDAASADPSASAQ
jgi:hypothetical protein